MPLDDRHPLSPGIDTPALVCEICGHQSAYLVLVPDEAGRRRCVAIQCRLCADPTPAVPDGPAIPARPAPSTPSPAG